MCQSTKSNTITKILRTKNTIHDKFYFDVYTWNSSTKKREPLERGSQRLRLVS